MSTGYYTSQYFTTTLAVVGGITDAQTTGIILQSVTGIQSTAKPGIALLSYADPLNETNAEWVKFNSINSTTKELVGVTRGAEKGSAKAHSNGVTVAFPISESHINPLVDAVSIEGVATNIVTTTKDEDDMASNSATALATQQSIKAYTDSFHTGWVPAGETWTYASADDPTFTFTVAGVDLTTKYSAGMRIKLTQTTVKYFIITAVAFSTDTTITVYGGTDYDLANEAITSPYFSTQKAPQGFPLDPTKWSVEATDVTLRTQATPANGTWYNLTGASIGVPIGCWDVSYKCSVGAIDASDIDFDFFATISTANNSESDVDFTCVMDTKSTRFFTTFFTKKIITIAAKATYYLNIKTATTGVDNMYLRNDKAKMIIRAVCAYL